MRIYAVYSVILLGEKNADVLPSSTLVCATTEPRAGFSVLCPSGQAIVVEHLMTVALLR